jgi:hypothetical protein
MNLFLHGPREDSAFGAACFDDASLDVGRAFGEQSTPM